MLSDSVTEVIFVGLPGPTHHYSGLSLDNVAATTNRGSESNPREAALQAIELAKLLKSLGIEAAILPPQLRPHMGLLRQHFEGEDAEVLRRASREAPQLLEKASSSSAMWTANAATVCPAVDAGDGKLHLSVANLFTNLHRRIEAEDTYHVLSAIFQQVPNCEIHRPLSAMAGLHDEGAANHMRLSPSHSARGLHVFVYGADGKLSDPSSARQTLSASKAVAAQHRLSESQTVFIKQNPYAIRTGVFHNDVISVSNESVLLTHEHAFQAGRIDIDDIRRAYQSLHPGQALQVISISAEDLSIEEAVHTYFFNSQIVTKPDGAMAIIAPGEVRDLYDGKAAELMERIQTDATNPIDEVIYADLRQSMRNGGGPACLRLRVPVTAPQLTALREHSRVLADDVLLQTLTNIVERHYPKQLVSGDLGDAALLENVKQIFGEFSHAMRLPLPGD